MAQYSKFIRPGYVRVDATKNPTSDVYISAYKKDDDVVVVAVNRGTSPKTITISVPGTKVTSWEKYVTSGSKNLAQETDINAPSGSFQITLDASSVTSFVGKATPGIPSVSLTAPANKTTFTTPATIDIAATASDPDGSISKVEFYNGTAKLGEDASSPYSYSWTNVAKGSYTLTAVVTDNAGNKATSAPITIKVNVPQGPYNDQIHTIPGRIEAEEYDRGGEGLAYHEANSNGNEGGANLRNDQVDIETTGDIDGNYNIAYIMQGEWLEYTVDVLATDVYGLNLRVAADGDGKVFHIEMDGSDITGTIAVPNTGGWQTWQTVMVNNIHLAEGEHIMRIVFDSDYMNLNYVEFTGVVTGVNSNLLTDAEIFPNPFTENGTYIRISGDFQYKITDLEGALVQSGHGRGNKIVGENIEPGIYFLSIQRNNEIIIKKIVRQ